MPHKLKLALAAASGLLLGGLLVWIALPPAGAQRAALPPPDAPPAGAQRAAPPTRDDKRQASTNARETVTRQAARSGAIRGVARFIDGTLAEGLPLVAERARDNQMDAMTFRAMAPFEQHRHVRETLQWAKEQSVQAATGPGGRFAFTGLEGAFVLYSGDRARPLAEGDVKCHAGDELDILVKRAAFIDLDLVYETGEPINRAVVTINGQNRQGWVRGTEIEVDAGLAEIAVSTSTAVTTFTGQATIEAPAQPEAHKVAIELKGEPVLAISVVRPRQYYPNVRMNLYPTDTLQAGFPAHPRDLFDKRGIAGEDNWGGHRPFMFKNLAPGRYTAIVTGGGTANIIGRLEVDYRGGLQQEELKVAEPTLDDHIVLRISDPDGKPVTDANVRLSMHESWTSYVDPVIPKGDGEYWIARIPPEKFVRNGSTPGAEYIIYVDHPQHGAHTLFVPVDAREEITLRFGAKATLVVHVENLPADRGNFELLVGPRGGTRYQGPMSPETTKPLADRSEFELASGPLTVTLFGRQPANIHARWLFERREIELSPQGTELRLRLPDLYTLNVSVPDDVRASYLELPWDDRSTRLDLDAERKVKFVNIPAGEHVLACPSGSMVVRLPHEGELVFVANPYNGLRVTHVAGELTATGLKVNDVIREVCGTALSGTQQGIRTEAINAARDKEQVDLRVQRDGLWVTLAVQPEHWTRSTLFQLRVRMVRVAD